jgi:hypothetical protein
MTETYSVSDHFSNKDLSVRSMYDELLKILNRFGPVEEDPRKTSIYINHRSALVGVETRKKYILPGRWKWNSSSRPGSCAASARS